MKKESLTKKIKEGRRDGRRGIKKVGQTEGQPDGRVRKEGFDKQTAPYRKE